MFLRIGSALLAAALCSAAAHAAILAEEDFDFGAPPFSIIGTGSGSGWAGNWGGESGTAQSVVTRSLTYAVPSTAFTLNSGSSQVLQATGAVDNLAYRQLSPSFSGPEVLVSAFIRLEPGFTITNNDFLGIWLDDITTGTHLDTPSFGIKANQGDGTGTSDVFIRHNLTGGAGDIDYVPSPKGNLSAGQTVFLVVSFQKTGPGTEYNYAELWMDPAFDDGSLPPNRPAADISVALTTIGIEEIDYVGMRTFGISGGDAFSVDRVRVATTWWEVWDEPIELLVELESFTASSEGPGSAVELSWTTSLEVDNAGFEVYREDGGDLVKLSSGLIPAEGNEMTGATYEFTDSAAPADWDTPPRYFIKDVDIYGESTLHGPAVYDLKTATSVSDWELYR